MTTTFKLKMSLLLASLLTTGCQTTSYSKSKAPTQSFATLPTTESVNFKGPSISKKTASKKKPAKRQGPSVNSIQHRTDANFGLYTLRDVNKDKAIIKKANENSLASAFD